MFLFNNINLSLVAYVFIFLLSLKLVMKAKVKNTYLDPGLIFITVVFLSLAPACLGIAIGYNIFSPFWRISKPEELLLVLEFSSILMFMFSVFYYFFSDRRKSNFVFNNVSKLHFSKHWILVYIIILFATIFAGMIGINKYLYAIITNLETVARVILAGIIISRSKTIFRARIMGISLLLFMLFFSGFSNEDGQYIANKGGAFLISLGAIAYADRVRWHGKLLTGKMFVLALPAAMFLLALANFVEAYLGGSSLSTYNFLIYFAMGFEPRIMENVSIVVDWVNTGVEQLRYGSTYFNTMVEMVYPLADHLSLSDWLVIKISGPSYVGKVGYAFSPLAEGYLNFGYFGIFIAAFYCACVASIIRYFYISERFWMLGPFFYGISLRLSYFLYRYESQAVLKRLEYDIINILVLFIIFKMISHISKTLKADIDQNIIVIK